MHSTEKCHWTQCVKITLDEIFEDIVLFHEFISIINEYDFSQDVWFRITNPFMVAKEFKPPMGLALMNDAHCMSHRSIPMA